MPKKNLKVNSAVFKPTFLRVRQISERIGVSVATIWKWTRDGNFPRPVKLAENSTAWRTSDVESWEKSRH